MPESDIPAILSTVDVNNLTWNDFTCPATLGSGSFGTTMHIRIGESDFALKHFHESERHDARWVNEKWALEKLKHRAVPRFYGAGRLDGAPYILMSLAGGKSLDARLQEDMEQKTKMSEVNLCAILSEIFDALTYIHDQGIIHRDIKPDNLLVSATESRIWIIDFGLCNAPNRPADAQSMQRVGAIRYCPPDKARDSSQKTAKDDVFAVGITAYLMLAWQHPWIIREGMADKEIADVMGSAEPTPLSQHCVVEENVERFIHSLIDRDEARRPNATAASKQCQELLRSIHPQARVENDNSGGEMIFPRLTLDPVHGDIRMTELEWSVINTPEFQRLRYMRQLGFSHLVYAGAEHTRFGHSIGTMHVADRILRTIRKSQEETISDYDLNEIEMRQMMRLYALVHDVTHIPFGHTLEDELGFFKRHDDNFARTRRLIILEKSSLGKILKSHEVGRRVLDHLDPSATIRKQTYLSEIITSPYGADVLDYIDRDSYFCGLNHRVDASIYRRFKIKINADGEGRFLVQTFGRHGRRMDTEFTLEEIPNQRYALFMKVYCHARKVAASAMLGKAIHDLIFQRKEMDESKIEWMGDDELLVRIRDYGGKAGDLAKRIMQRALYKPVYEANPLGIGLHEVSATTIDGAAKELGAKGLLEPRSRRAIEERIASKAGIAERNCIIYCLPKPPGYTRQMYHVREREDAVVASKYVVADKHPALVRKHAALWKLIVLVPPDLDAQSRAKVAAASAEEFDKENELTPSARQKTFGF